MTKDELATLGKKVDLERVLGFLREEKIVEKSQTWEKIPFYKPTGSGESLDESFHGRVVIHEVLRVTPTIKSLIIKGAASDEIENQAKREGMMTMLEDGVFKAVQGMTTLEEVLRVITE